MDLPRIFQFASTQGITGTLSFPDGLTLHFKDGKLHRDYGPAAEWPDGTKQFYRHGKLHREYGPAVEYGDGDTFWYLDGVSIPAPLSPPRPRP